MHQNAFLLPHIQLSGSLAHTANPLEISMEPTLKRISLLIREDQYERISERELNLSGLVRDLLDDYLSHHKVTVSVGEETRHLYDQIVANTGTSDSDIEQYFREALRSLLKQKIAEMQSLASRFEDPSRALIANPAPTA